MTEVAIEALNARLADYVSRAQQGERIRCRKLERRQAGRNAPEAAVPWQERLGHRSGRPALILYLDDRQKEAARAETEEALLREDVEWGLRGKD